MPSSPDAPAAPHRLRVWHQSVTDLSTLPGYRSELEALARAVLPDAEVSVNGVAAGTYPTGVAPITALRSAWAEHLLGVQIVLGARRAEAAGYDAVAVSCFFDPALAAARAAVGIPVVSAGETSIIVATALGRMAGLIALDEGQVISLRTLVRAAGLEGRVAAIVALDPPVTEFDLAQGMDDDELMSRVGAAAARVLASGADAVVPAEGVLNTRLARMDVRSMGGAPLVDSFTSVLCHAAMMAAISRGRPPAADSSRSIADHIARRTGRLLA